MKSIRIGDIELRKTKSLKDVEYWEIIKWFPNCHYQKQDEYEEVEPYRYRSLKYPNYYVNGKDIFNRPQSCYTIYIVKEANEEPDLESVGRRPYILAKDELEDLQEVIEYLYKQYDKGEF